jgi:predicted small secreted protein
MKEESPMKTLTVLIASCLLLFLVGCNTVKGAGQDIQKVGEKIEDAAKKKQ